jgi:hypothetical protein
VLSWQSAKKLALSLPEAEERDHFGSPSFHVRGKIFGQLSAKETSESRAILKLSGADQAALVLIDSDTFSVIPQWGRHGWTYARLSGVDAAVFGDLLRQSWRQVAPKKLVAAHAGHGTWDSPPRWPNSI